MNTALLTDLHNLRQKHARELINLEIDGFQSASYDAHDIISDLIVAIDAAQEGALPHEAAYDSTFNKHDLGVQ